jgi:hypothetical protein
MEGTYEWANQQRMLTTWIEWYTKTLSVTKVAVNFSKAKTFTYEIRNLDPLTQTLFYYQMHYNKHYFPHTIHRKCSKLQRTLHKFLQWISVIVFCTGKITCSCSEVVLRTMKNYKAHYSLS